MSMGVRLFGVDRQGIVVELFTERGCEYPDGVVHAWEDDRLPFKTKGCRQYVRISDGDPYEEEEAGTLPLAKVPKALREAVAKLRVNEPDANGLLEPDQVRWTGAREGGPGEWEEDWDQPAAEPPPSMPELDPALFEQPLRAALRVMADTWLAESHRTLAGALEVRFAGRGEALADEIVDDAVFGLSDVDLHILGYRTLHPDAASFDVVRVGEHFGFNKFELLLWERELHAKLRRAVEAGLRRMLGR